MVRTRFILIRHGQTVDNAAKRAQGQLPGQLNERGEAQARAAARRLRGEDIAAVYSSDLARARQTASIITAATGHDILFDKRLRERHYGILQGRRWDENEIIHPEVQRQYRSGNPDYVIPGGESYRQFYRRTVASVEDIAARHEAETVLIVTHGGVAGCMLRYVVGIPLEQPRRFWVANASLNIFARREGQWLLETWGDVEHLRGLE